MKKSLLIAGGTIIILLLVALWVYLLFFGKPKNVEDVFTSFDFTEGEEFIPAVPIAPIEENPLVNVNGKPLRQLTIRPVIGYREVLKTPSSTPEVYYAEAGTGHVYSINLVTGIEERVSGTTVADAIRADFTDNGSHIAIQSGAGRALKTLLGKLNTGSGSANLSTLNDSIEDFTIARSGELLYTVKNAVLVGKAMSLRTEAPRTLFTLPFRDATIVWGNKATTTHYAYPKTSYQLEGFVYGINGTVLTRLPLEGYGLMADAGAGVITTTQNRGESPEAYFYDINDKQKYSAPFLLFPEKCVFSVRNPGQVWCASYNGSIANGFPDSWYSGDTTSQDAIYSVFLSSDALATTNLVDTLAESGRAVDVTQMGIGASEQNLYFINKNDNTLWMYELAL